MCIAGAAFGTLLGMGTSAAVRNSVSIEDLRDWGWRIPFLLTPVVGTAGYLLRRNIEETEEFEAESTNSTQERKQVYKDLITKHWLEILLGSFSLIGWCPTFYLVFTWY